MSDATNAGSLRFNLFTCLHVCVCATCGSGVCNWHQQHGNASTGTSSLQLVLLLSECLVFWRVCRLAVQALCNELASEHGNSASTMVFAVNLLWCCACATCGSGERWNVSCCGRLSSQQRRKRYHLSCQLLVLCVSVCACATCGSGDAAGGPTEHSGASCGIPVNRVNRWCSAFVCATCGSGVCNWRQQHGNASTGTSSVRMSGVLVCVPSCGSGVMQ
jgi:hypothetical protein